MSLNRGTVTGDPRRCFYFNIGRESISHGGKKGSTWWGGDFGFGDFFGEIFPLI